MKHLVVIIVITLICIGFTCSSASGDPPDVKIHKKGRILDHSIHGNSSISITITFEERIDNSTYRLFNENFSSVKFSNNSIYLYSMVFDLGNLTYGIHEFNYSVIWYLNDTINYYNTTFNVTRIKDFQTEFMAPNVFTKDNRSVQLNFTSFITLRDLSFNIWTGKGVAISFKNFSYDELQPGTILYPFSIDRKRCEHQIHEEWITIEIIGYDNSSTVEVKEVQMYDLDLSDLSFKENDDGDEILYLQYLLFTSIVLCILVVIIRTRSQKI